MNKTRPFFLILGVLFLLFSLVEWILCFYGPIILDIKSTTFIFPLYSAIENPEVSAIRDTFRENLKKSRRYIVIDREYAESFFAREGKEFKEIIKRASITKYAETAKQIGAEKFIMGYILKDDEGYELFIHILLTKQAQSALKERVNAPDVQTLLKKIPGFMTKLDGGEKGYSIPEILYFYVLLFHALFGLFLIVQALIPQLLPGFIVKPDKFYRVTGFLKVRLPEFLFIYTLLLFIFAYIYALNANMDYVQKFMATGGKLHLAQSTTQERINSVLRYIPLLGLSSFFLIWTRIKTKILGLREYIDKDFRVVWALPLTILSALFMSLSLPSFLDINGWPILGFLCLVPFFLVIEKNSWKTGVFYGVIFGTYNTIFTSYWLGTFDLVSLQLVMFIFLASYIIFMIPAVWIYKHAGKIRFLVFPAAWVVFDFLQSIGFAGYPWSMVGISQYGFTPLIQISALTGVWGVTFIVVLANAVLAYSLNASLVKKSKVARFPLILFGGIFILVLAGGFIYMGVTATEKRDTVRIAQIQDSLDPRKHQTYEVLTELMRLTDMAIKEKPDIVVWPEGSFDMDYIAFPNAVYVEDLRKYQQKTKTWLLTGSMEYKDKNLARTPSNDAELDSYNSSILLTPEGDAKQSYYKIHLVPFSEYFPYKKELPWMYKMLKEFDINWWEKGETRVIFEHPLFTFFTPICYEDVFPGEISLFVKDGADIIMNLSNDFWSLSPAEGKQHAVIALFRAVENRRPLLRTTTSGLTCYIDIHGRIKKSLPYFENGYYIVDVPLPGKDFTFYTIAGDWFPWFLLACLGILSIISFFPWFRSKME